MLGPMSAEEAPTADDASGTDTSDTSDTTDASRPGETAADPGGFVTVDDPAAGRWELRSGDRVVGVAQYALVDPTESSPERVVFFHTEVEPEFEGRGLASVLARAALDGVIASGRTIVTICPYIRAWVKRHPDPYAAHVAPASSADVDAMNRAVGKAPRK
jgi:predicted GNAT family acetyltransferase